MKDSDFKMLSHCVGEFCIASRGNEVSDGYKPDLTVTDQRGALQFIIECEQKTDRKAFLGDLLKAERYAEECKSNPTLVIVMQQADNTKVQQIARQIQSYAHWLHRRGSDGLYISRIVVMSDTEYVQSVQDGEILGTQNFLDRGEVIDIPWS